MRKTRKPLKTLAAALTAAMAFQSVALAAPMDELNEILEKQQEIESDLDVALEEQLGLDELGKAVEENGLHFVIDLESAGGALGEVLPEGSYYHGNLQIDKKQKNWLLESGVGTAESAILDFALYGDEQKLAISIPQFYDGAITLFGNLLEQYNGSALKGLIESMGGDSAAGFEIPDIDLTFWPKEKEAEDDTPDAELDSELENKILAIAEKTDVEKIEEDDATIYRLTISTADLGELYKEILDKYVEVFSSLAAFASSSDSDLEQMPQQIDQMVDEMVTVLGDSITVDFHIKDDLLEKISYHIYVDTTSLEEKTENSEDADTIMEVNEPFQGNLDYEIAFVDPSQPMKQMDFTMTMTDLEQNEFARMFITMKTEREGTTVTSSLESELEFKEEEETESIPFVSGQLTYDTVSQDLDGELVIKTEEDSVIYTLDSTFSEIEKGKSFCWNVDELSATVGGETIGLKAKIDLSADAGEIAAPEKEISLFSADQNEVYGLIGQLAMNAQTWAAQFAPETAVIETTTESLEDTAA